LSYFAHLWLFFVLVFGVVLLPGMDMAYVLGSSLTGGLRNGFAAVLGLVAGAACHVTMGTLGIGLLLKLYPAAFNLLLIGGALYIVWIGWSIFKHATTFNLKPDEMRRTAWASFRRGIVINLTNPNAYLFTLAVYPQFFRPEYGPIVAQALAMWTIIAVTQVAVYGSVVLAAHGVRRWLASNPDSGIMIGRGVGIMLMLAAVFTAAKSLKV